jgi:hypothetical protein
MPPVAAADKKGELPRACVGPLATRFRPTPQSADTGGWRGSAAGRGARISRTGGYFAPLPTTGAPIGPGTRIHVPAPGEGILIILHLPTDLRVCRPRLSATGIELPVMAAA